MNDDNDNRRAYHDDVDDADYGRVPDSYICIILSNTIKNVEDLTHVRTCWNLLRWTVRIAGGLNTNVCLVALCGM